VPPFGGGGGCGPFGRAGSFLLELQQEEASPGVAEQQEHAGDEEEERLLFLAEHAQEQLHPLGHLVLLLLGALLPFELQVAEMGQGRWVGGKGRLGGGIARRGGGRQRWGRRQASLRIGFRRFGGIKM